MEQLTPMNLYTKVKVLKGVPFDSSYRNVCDDYVDASNQASVICGDSNNRVKYSFDNISPIRLQNVIRLPICADLVYDCNYIMWQNYNFSTKWFYAFITGVDWININCCHIHYVIDVWNTWYFHGFGSNPNARGWTIEHSFVEREHTNDDTIGKNLLPENVETGEYIWYENPKTTGIMSKSVCIAVVSNRVPIFNGNVPIFQDFYGKMVDNMFTGLHICAFNTNKSAITKLKAFLALFSTDTGGANIFGIFMMPKYFSSRISTGYDFDGDLDFQSVSLLIGNSRPEFLDTYEPRNNKLYTYPYTFLNVSNGQGTNSQFPYEYFSKKDTAEFILRGTCLTGKPEFVLSPLKYKGRNDNIDESVVLDNFPQCSWSSNAFIDWFSANCVNVGTALLSNSVSQIGHGYNLVSQIKNANANFEETGEKTDFAGSMSGHLEGIAQDGIAIANILGNTGLKMITAGNYHGTQSASTMATAGKIDYYYGNMGIRKEFAQIIDSYFDRFGYATHETKIPNLTGRLNWNYVKTIGCNINANYISLDDVSTLEGIFDKGVTIWHSMYNIGNFSLENPII